jgi:hypothetical protein
VESEAEVKPYVAGAVVDVPGVTADELYTRARSWFATTFVSANAVLQLQDAANHVLIGHACR